MIDGPFAEIQGTDCRLLAWQVRSLEEAIEWVKRCPNPMPGESEIEIRQVFETEEFASVMSEEDTRAGEASFARAWRASSRIAAVGMCA